MKLTSSNQGFKLIELVFSVAIASVVGLILYSILYSGLVLGAKNTAINTAHHQARVAMINMLGDLHSAISLPALTDANATPYASPVPTNAAGISFQKWSSGPHKIKSDANAGNTQIHLVLTTGAQNPTPIVGQHLIIPSHQIEADISAVSGNSGDYVVTLSNIYGPSVTPPLTYPVSTLPVDIKGTGSSAGDITCFITDRCSYTVSNATLNWTWQGTSRISGSDITNQTPFSIPTTAAGALYYRFVAAIDLSTSDVKYSNRGYKSANILLNGQVPQKTRLTTYQ
ncbi:MAG: PulJ/GspJ family protein [Chthoniobacterales bacterium]